MKTRLRVFIGLGLYIYIRRGLLYTGGPARG